MSSRFLKLPHSIAKSKGLSLSEFRVLIYIMCFDPSYPSHALIAKETGLNKNTVNKALRGLKLKNVIVWSKGNSRGKSNRYKFNPKHLWKLTENHPKKWGRTTPNFRKPNRTRKEIYPEEYEKEFELTDLSIEEIEAKYSPKNQDSK